MKKIILRPFVFHEPRNPKCKCSRCTAIRSLKGERS